MIKLLVSYDGRAFFGSQRQAGQRTVQGELEAAAATVFGQEIPIYLAGRTDRGVHAAGQVASFAQPHKVLESVRLTAAFNDHLDADIAVLGAERVPIGFHARYGAQWREYRYRIWSGVRQPLAHGYVWSLRWPLEVEAMNCAARVLIGEHDFSSFASGGEGVPWSDVRSTTRGARRRVFSAKVVEAERWWGSSDGDGSLFEVRVVADGFLPRMVRGIAGALAEVGRGSLSVEDIEQLLRRSDRRQAPRNAPPDGLVLWAVGYTPFSE